MKGIYLAAYRAYHPDFNIIYQDINGNRDISGDMMDIDLDPYDFIIATPPCNYWSRARGNKKPSNYALNTAHLLPDIIFKLKDLNKPFIVENVRNDKKFKDLGILDLNNVYVYRIGRHTYWSSCMFNQWINQTVEYVKYHHDTKIDSRQGSVNVHNVIESWLKEIHNNY